MGLFTQLFGDLVAFVYHCFDRIVIHGYLTGLSRPDQMAHFFRQVIGVPVITKEMLNERTASYQTWVEAFARNHRTPIRWAEKGVRKEDYVLPWLRRMVRKSLPQVHPLRGAACFALAAASSANDSNTSGSRCCQNRRLGQVGATGPLPAHIHHGLERSTRP
jgi:hypothetical protein